ncbi:hypothetical protein HK405_004591 [Cladochytrium tenue]|nr:hypothetical protein HK405_004591 [Cladochytrium tenue]
MIQPVYSNITKIEREIASKELASIVRQNISLSHTYEPDHYEPHFDVKEDHGTMHVSVLTADGDAVSLTSTVRKYIYEEYLFAFKVNLVFGAQLMDSDTGIILNDEMDDFSIPGVPNAFGLVPSPYNYVQPGKRPLSSSVPTIIERNGRVELVTGASGGSRIITATLQTILNMVDFGMSLAGATAAPRLHHQLIPNEIQVEFEYDPGLTHELETLGHKASKASTVVGRTVDFLRLRTCAKRRPGQDGDTSMDDFLDALVEEVALEGGSGCSLDRFWDLLGEVWRRSRIVDIEEEAAAAEAALTGAPSLISGWSRFVNLVLYTDPSPALDAAMRDYLWPYVMRLDLIEFITPDMSASPAPPAAASLESGKKTKSKKASMIEAAQSLNKAKQELKERLTAMTQAEIKESFGADLRVVAAETARRMFFTGTNDLTEALPAVSSNVLEAIGKTKDSGITQADLAKKLGMEPRSLFYQVKNLCKRKFIVKMPIVTKGMYTSLLVHSKFASMNPSLLEYERSQQLTRKNLDHRNVLAFIENSVRLQTNAASGRVSFHSELLKQRLTLLLTSAKNNVMLVEDVMNALLTGTFTRHERKWLNRTISSLTSGFVEKVQIAVNGSNVRAIRLLKQYVATASSFGPSNLTINPSSSVPTLAPPTSARKYTHAADPESSMVLGEGGFLCDLLLDSQVYRIISIAGGTGTTSNVVRSSLNNVNVRVLEKVLRRQLASVEGAPVLVSEGEFSGRGRRYRYYLTSVRLASTEVSGLGSTPAGPFSIPAVSRRSRRRL